MIQLTQNALLRDPTDVPQLTEDFRKTGCARLPGFLGPQILSPLLRWLDEARFEKRHEKNQETGAVFGTTMFVPETESALFLFTFMLNRLDLFRLVREISGCPEIGNYIGRVHRTSSGAQHIDWHRDAVDTRALGLCINLSTENYEGGIFQLRDPEKVLRAEVGCSNPGDAFLFRIDMEWQHRLTPIESGRRTVGVGWFRTAPDWRTYAYSIARTREVLPMLPQPATGSAIYPLQQ